MQRFLKNKLSTILGIGFITASFFAMVLAPTVHAQSNTIANGNLSANVVDVPLAQITDTFGGKGVSEVSLQIIKILLLLIIMAAVIVIAIAGFRMATGGNNPEQLKKSKKAIAWAIIGILVALMSYSIVAIITRVF